MNSTGADSAATTPSASRAVNHAEARPAVAGLALSGVTLPVIGTGAALGCTTVTSVADDSTVSGTTTLAMASPRSGGVSIVGADGRSADGKDVVLAGPASRIAGRGVAAGGAGSVTSDPVMIGIVIGRPASIRSRLPRVKLSGLAAKIASAASRIVVGLSPILAAMPDSVSPRTTR